MLSLFRIRHAIRLGFRSLGAHRLRTSLTALGIILGVASVIVMLAVGEAAREQALKQLRDLGANTIVLTTVKPQDSGEAKGQRDESEFGLKYADLVRLKATIPTITSATPMREFRKRLWHGPKKMECRVVTITPEFLEQNKIALAAGRGFEPADEANLSNVAILGSTAVEQLFPGEQPLGKNVILESMMRNFPMTVVGVIEPKTAAGGDGSGGDWNAVVFIPFEFDRVRIGRELVTVTQSSEKIEKIEISQITATVTSLEEVPRTAEAIRSAIDQFHPDKDVQILVPLDLLRKAEETQRMFTIILGAIAGISLLVGGIGIMNIMLASVTERTREIGIRRALGAKQGDIALQFLVETLVLSCGGGLIGLVLGIGSAFLLKAATSIETKVELWSVFVAFFVSVLVGLMSGLYPARSAARLDPIEALRHS